MNESSSMIDGEKMPGGEKSVGLGADYEFPAIESHMFDHLGGPGCRSADSKPVGIFHGACMMAEVLHCGCCASETRVSFKLTCKMQSSTMVLLSDAEF